MSAPAVSIRDRILEAAFAAFTRHGYTGASTAQIARLAKVSKRDLYTQFGSKQAMLAACVAERAERMSRPLSLPMPRDIHALRETLVRYGMTLLRELGEPEVLATYRLAIQEAENAPDLAATLDRLGRAGTTEALTRLLATARAQGLIGSGDPGETAELFLAVLLDEGLLVRMLMRLAPPPGEDEARRRAESAVRSLPCFAPPAL